MTTGAKIKGITETEADSAATDKETTIETTTERIIGTITAIITVAGTEADSAATDKERIIGTTTERIIGIITEADSAATGRALTAADVTVRAADRDRALTADVTMTADAITAAVLQARDKERTAVLYRKVR